MSPVDLSLHSSLLPSFPLFLSLPFSLPFSHLSFTPSSYPTLSSLSLQLRYKDLHLFLSLMSSRLSTVFICQLINMDAMSFSRHMCSMCLVLRKVPQTRLHLTYATQPCHDNAALSMRKTCHEEAQRQDARWWSKAVSFSFP